MKRFFFDCTMKDQSLYDYQGDEFQSPQVRSILRKRLRRI